MLNSGNSDESSISYENLNTSTPDTDKLILDNYSRMEKYELTKRQKTPKVEKSKYIESLDIANYTNEKTASDFYID